MMQFPLRTARLTAVIAALAAGILLAALLAAPSARAYKSDFVAAPSYPHSTLAMEVLGKPRARGIAKLRVSGSNVSQDDGDGLAFDYSLDVFVQDRRVFDDCPQAMREMRNRLINLPAKVEHIGIDLNEGPSGPFETTIVYRTESFRRLMYCAYTTYVIDDVAMSWLKHNLRKARKR